MEILNRRREDTLTWGIRLEIYKYVNTPMLLKVITNISKRERKYLAQSHISGNRRITINLPTGYRYSSEPNSQL